MWRRRGLQAVLGTWVVAGALGLTGCGGGDGAAPPTTDAPATTSPATSASERTTSTPTVDATTATTAPAPTSSTTFAQNPTPPPLINTGTDYEAIAVSMLARLEWLSVHPSVEGLAAVVRRDSPAWNDLFPVFDNAVREGLRTDGSDPGFASEVRVIDDTNPDEVSVYLAITNPPFIVVNLSGEVIESNSGDPPQGWAYVIVKESGTWLLHDRQVLGEI